MTEKSQTLFDPIKYEKAVKKANRMADELLEFCKENNIGLLSRGTSSIPNVVVRTTFGLRGEAPTK